MRSLDTYNTVLKDQVKIIEEKLFEERKTSTNIYIKPLNSLWRENYTSGTYTCFIVECPKIIDAFGAEQGILLKIVSQNATGVHFVIFDDNKIILLNDLNNYFFDLEVEPYINRNYARFFYSLCSNDELKYLREALENPMILQKMKTEIFRPFKVDPFLAKVLVLGESYDVNKRIKNKDLKDSSSYYNGLSFSSSQQSIDRIIDYLNQNYETNIGYQDYDELFKLAEDSGIILIPRSLLSNYSGAVKSIIGFMKEYIKFMLTYTDIIILSVGKKSKTFVSRCIMDLHGDYNTSDLNKRVFYMRSVNHSIVNKLKPEHPQSFESEDVIKKLRDAGVRL